MRDIAIVVNNSNKEVSPIETIDAIKKAGFKNVFIQWYNKDWKPTQEEQLRYVRKQNLNVIFAHLGYSRINDIWLKAEEGDIVTAEYKNDIRTCKDNNIPMVIMHLTSKTEAPPLNEIGLKRIQEIVDYAQELGVKVAFENTKIRGYLEYIMDNIKNENVGICLDSGHYHAHFNDDWDFTEFKNRIFAVHLHDNDQSDDQHLIPFDGTLDWKAFLMKLKACNYKGVITLEAKYCTSDYLEMGIDSFYNKCYDVANKVRDMIEE